MLGADVGSDKRAADHVPGERSARQKIIFRIRLFFSAGPETDKAENYKISADR